MKDSQQDNKKDKILKRIVEIAFALSILFFIISFNFQDNRMNGWYPQYLTSLPPVSQLVFLDSLTGYYLGGSQYLLKTTNGETTGRYLNTSEIRLLLKNSSF